MQLFIEWTWRPTGIIRVGADCDRYGRGFSHAVVIVLPWFGLLLWLLGFRPIDVILKALVALPDNPMSRAESMKIVRYLRRRGFRATWERADDNEAGFRQFRTGKGILA